MENIKLYLIELVKMTLIFLLVRLVVDWLSDMQGFSVMHSLTNQLGFAFLFGAIIAVIRVMKIMRIRQEKAPDPDQDQ